MPENIKTCSHCGAPTSFERHDPLKEPNEGECCIKCGDWVCHDCIDWAYMARINAVDPTCKKCSAIPTETCARCGKEITEENKSSWTTMVCNDPKCESYASAMDW